jgi:hypothetical protein
MINTTSERRIQAPPAVASHRGRITDQHNKLTRTLKKSLELMGPAPI